MNDIIFKYETDTPVGTCVLYVDYHGIPMGPFVVHNCKTEESAKASAKRIFFSKLAELYKDIYSDTNDPNFLSSFGEYLEILEEKALKSLYLLLNNLSPVQLNYTGD